MSKLDLGLINGNNWDATALDAIEAGINIQRIIGTEAQRVAMTGVANGQGFYATDSFLEYVYDGTRWRTSGPDRFVGEVAGTATQPQNTTASLVDLLGASVNVPLLLGVRYRFTASVMAASTAAGDVAQLAVLVNGAVILAQVNYVNVVGNSNQITIPGSTWVCTLANGTYAAKLQYGRFNGTGMISGRHDLTVPRLLVERA